MKTLAPFSPVFYGGEGLGMRGIAINELGRLQSVRQCLNPLTLDPSPQKKRSEEVVFSGEHMFRTLQLSSAKG